jgi:hypothetical protein
MAARCGHPRDGPAQRPEPEGHNAGQCRNGVGPGTGGVHNDMRAVCLPVRHRDVPAFGVARNRRDGGAGPNFSTRCADGLGEMLHHPVGVDIPGPVVEPRARHMGGVQDWHMLPRFLRRDRRQRHLVDIRFGLRLFARATQQHEPARRQKTAIERVMSRARRHVQCDGNGVAVIGLEKRGRPARGVIGQRAFAFQQEDRAKLRQTRPGRGACDAAADHDEIPSHAGRDRMGAAGGKLRRRDCAASGVALGSGVSGHEAPQRR